MIYVLFYRKVGDASFTMHGYHLGTELKVAHQLAAEKWAARGDCEAMELRCTTQDGWKTLYAYDGRAWTCPTT